MGACSSGEIEGPSVMYLLDMRRRLTTSCPQSIFDRAVERVDSPFCDCKESVVNSVGGELSIESQR